MWMGLRHIGVAPTVALEDALVHFATRNGCLTGAAQAQGPNYNPMGEEEEATFDPALLVQTVSSVIDQNGAIIDRGMSFQVKNELYTNPFFGLPYALHVTCACVPRCFRCLCRWRWRQRWRSRARFSIDPSSERRLAEGTGALSGQQPGPRVGSSSTARCGLRAPPRSTKRHAQLLYFAQPAQSPHYALTLSASFRRALRSPRRTPTRFGTTSAAQQHP